MSEKCVRCEEEEVSEKVEALKGQLHEFESDVHDRRLDEDSSYDSSLGLLLQANLQDPRAKISRIWRFFTEKRPKTPRQNNS
jgi:hypothetical protein